jgi:hypothetical protein
LISKLKSINLFSKKYKTNGPIFTSIIYVHPISRVYKHGNMYQVKTMREPERSIDLDHSKIIINRSFDMNKKILTADSCRIKSLEN